MANEAPHLTFDALRALIRNLPGPDLDAATETVRREARLAKPIGSLGRLEDLALWLATWRGAHPPAIRHPRVAVFAGCHGVVEGAGSATPSVARDVDLFQRGVSPVNQLCAVADAELTLHELSLETTTRDFTRGPAMSEEECANAIAYGMLAVDTGVDLLVLGEIGDASELSAAAIAIAMWGGPVGDWLGGEGDASAARDADLVAAALAANPGARADPLEALRCLGGFETAAIVGAVLAARMTRVPVLLDGFAGTVAASVPVKINPAAFDHCLVAQRRPEPGHGRLLGRLNAAPLLGFDLSLGRGAGAVLAINILRSAALCHSGTADRAEAGAGDA